MGARCAPAGADGENPAKQLAWSLVDRYAIIVGSGFLAPVARRWKAQLNENGKATAAFEELPEATHNTVVGFEQPESLRDHLFVVFLGERARTIRATPCERSSSARCSDRRHRAHQVVEARGRAGLGRRCPRLTLGDYVSVYVAFAYAVDPTPVTVIDHIKGRSRWPTRRAAEGAARDRRGGPVPFLAESLV